MHFLTQPPRFLFFTGKGGVGKTSIACATAVQLATQGKRVLLVSTDPASNVGQVFDERIGNHITTIAAVKLPLEMGVLSFVQNVDKELRNGGKASTCGIHAGI